MWGQLEARLPGTPFGIATVGPNPTFEGIEACHAATDPGSAPETGASKALPSR